MSEKQETGIEAAFGLEKMTIHQCQHLAEKLGFDSTEFYLCGPKGKMKAKWLDAYMGLFQVGDEPGFNTVGQIALASNLWCEGLREVSK